jgi:hypothetical protein
MTDGSGWWCSSLRSRLLNAIGIEYALRRRVNVRPLSEHRKGSLLLTFFFAPCAEPELLTRLRLLITSVFRLIGRGLPWSLRNRPQALQSTEPISSRRQRGVVEVVQFWHVGCAVSRSLAAIVAMVMMLGRNRYRGLIVRDKRRGNEIFHFAALLGGRDCAAEAEARHVRSDSGKSNGDRGG